MIKGQDPARIVLGNSFTADGFTGQHFDYMLANPPFGVDWKRIERQIKDEAEHLGDRGRFGAGLPRVSDGSLLFLQHMISKMKPVSEGGSRLAIVFSGSPLFSGAAGSGESEIRRWIIENDWLEGIVALPDQLFYNTGISTYFWIVTNRKADDRKGKRGPARRPRAVGQDAQEPWRRSARRSRDDQIAEITRLYHDAVNLDGNDDRVKVFPNAAFGYQRITVERPMRRRWYITDETITAITASKPFMALANPPKGATDPASAVHEGEKAQQRLIEALAGLRDRREDQEAAFDKHAWPRRSAKPGSPSRRPSARPSSAPPRSLIPMLPSSRDARVIRCPTRTCGTTRTSRSQRTSMLTWSARFCRTYPMRGWTRPRPRSATKSRSPATSTATRRRVQWPRSTPRSTLSRLRFSRFFGGRQMSVDLAPGRWPPNRAEHVRSRRIATLASADA